MKSYFFYFLFALLILCSGVLAQTSDAGRQDLKPLDPTSFTISPHYTVLYDNGPLSTGPLTKSGVAASTGSTWSECQNPANDTTQSNVTWGWAAGITTTVQYRLADNFTVPAGQSWTIDSISTFAWVGNANPGTSPFIALNVQFWNGRPGDAGAVVVAGDPATNRLSSSVWATYYRIANTKYPPPGTVQTTTRPVFRNNANMGGITLGPGTYWLDWQTQITASAAHYAPSVTVVGVRGNPAWNGRQWTGTLWQDAIDIGNPPPTAPDSAQDFPFVLMGSSTITGVDEQEVGIPQTFSLMQNYPNPFNPTTDIHYAVPQTSFVTLTVYNTLGHQVAQLVNEQQRAGCYDVVFRSEGLASGVYFYRIQSSAGVATKKLLLLK